MSDGGREPGFELLASITSHGIAAGQMLASVISTESKNMQS